ncbi:hypothetical protein Ancab_030135 [Ancistrocladus abbreviatus]
MSLEAEGSNAALPREDMKALLMKRYDLDKDHCLSQGELEIAFKRLGSRCPCWRAKLAMYHADYDADGLIHQDELNILVDYIRKRGFHVTPN